MKFIYTIIIICLFLTTACTKSTPESLGNEACSIYIDKMLHFYTGKKGSRDTMISDCKKRMIPYASQEFPAYQVAFKELKTCINDASDFASFERCKSIMVGGL